MFWCRNLYYDQKFSYEIWKRIFGNLTLKMKHLLISKYSTLIKMYENVLIIICKILQTCIDCQKCILFIFYIHVKLFKISNTQRNTLEKCAIIQVFISMY